MPNYQLPNELLEYHQLTSYLSGAQVADTHHLLRGTEGAAELRILGRGTWRAFLAALGDAAARASAALRARAASGTRR